MVVARERPRVAERLELVGAAVAVGIAQARELAESLGLHMVRAATVGTHPKFIAMIRELVEQRLSGAREAWPWPCEENCCPAPVHAGRPAGAHPSSKE